MPPVINKNLCKGCMTCADICPMDVFGYQKSDAKVPEIQFPDECWHCNGCVVDCPVGAVSLRVPLPAAIVFREPLIKEAKSMGNRAGFEHTGNKV